MDQELFQIVKKAKKGDQQAFSELVQRYQGSVFRQAYAMVNDKMEAEDITQEAFVKAYYSFSKLKSEYAFTSWLTRLVSNLCYDHLQKIQKRKQTQEKEKLIDRHVTMDQTQTKLSIQEALQTLSPDHREALILRDIQGFSYDEIATILKIPLGTVKSRISHARLDMKKELLRGEV